MITAQKVPSVGPLTLGAVYKRSQLHNRFGGNRNAGIVPSKKEPAILLFHTDEPVQQFYRDGFDGNGIYWYCGEGTKGEMSWTSGNRAVREHGNNGSDLLFFQRIQRKGGFWRFSFVLQYVCYKEEKRKDKVGVSRTAIVFGLVPLPDRSPLMAEWADVSLAELRHAAAGEGGLDDSLPIEVRLREMCRRSEAVQVYALGRARGVCEACGGSAPFTTVSGNPFLEVHRIDRLADAGPERIDRVAAICPNCHRRCHYALDYREFNSDLRSKVAAIEASQ